MTPSPLYLGGEELLDCSRVSLGFGLVVGAAERSLEQNGMNYRKRRNVGRPPF